MLAQRIYRPNPLAFRGGNPGFDPTHIAAQGGKVRLSVIPSGANLVDLLTGTPGTIVAGSGTPTSLVDGNLGPATNFPTAQGTGYVKFTGRDLTNFSALTCGAILRFNTAAAAVSFFNNSLVGTTAGIAFGISATGAIQLIALGVGSTTTSSVTLTAGIPYFVAASMNDTIANFFAMRLDTGTIQTQNGVSYTPAIVQPGGGYTVGNHSLANREMNGRIGALMFAGNYLPSQAILQWAQSPWDFWYPQTMRNLMFSGLGKAASGTAYNIAPVLGTYVQTGNAQTLNATRSIKPVAGAYAVSGNTATMTRGIGLTAAQGAYAVNGFPITFGHGVNTITGTYSAAGNAITFGHGLLPPTGAYALAGHAITDPVALSILGAKGTYAVTGNGATLTLIPFGTQTGVPQGLRFMADVGPMTSRQ